MVFTVEQVRAIRQGKVTAALVKTAERVKPGAVRSLRRQFTRHDSDGNAIETAVETVADPLPGGERRPVMLTILDVRDLELAELAVTDAKACGYHTATGLRDAWRQQHPRITYVRLVHFALGDLRDRPRFLTSFPARADYTTNPHEATPNEPESLSEQDLAIFAGLNGQRHARGRAELAVRLSMQSASQRLQRIQFVSEQMRIDIRREIRVIEQRVERAERRTQGR